MLVPLWRCAEATIELGTPAARAMDAATAFRASRACAPCRSHRATDWRGDGHHLHAVQCLVASNGVRPACV